MKLTIRSFGLATVLVAALACSDATAPRRSVADEVSFQVKTHRRTATTADITVMPSGGTFALGRHSIRFPKRAICELSSSYGVTEWDKPCQPAQGPVNFHVEILNANGRDFLNFTPNARFVPATRPSDYVMLFMRVDNIKDVSEDDLQILWSPTYGIPGIDESLSDSTLRTRVNYGAGMLQRRIKHFTTYVIRDGDCQITDPTCAITPPPTGGIGLDEGGL